jgi:tetratricopeptide (TPR) repeat protein
MDKNLCPFLKNKEGKSLSCMKEGCFLYDTDARTCIFKMIDLHNQENVTKLGKLIKKSSADNGVLIKKIGSLLNNGLKPMTEFFKAMENGKKIDELFTLLKEGGGSASFASGREDTWKTLEDLISQNGAILKEIAGLAGDGGPLALKMGETERAAREMRSSVIELKDAVKNALELAGEKIADQESEDPMASMKLLLETLKKPLAATLKIQKETFDKLTLFSESARETLEILPSFLADNRSSFNRITEVLDHHTEILEQFSQNPPLKNELAALSGQTEELTEIIKGGIESRGEESQRTLEVLQGIQEILHQMSQRLEKVETGMDNILTIREGMDICVESQKAMSLSFINGMGKMEAFAELQKEYLQSEESAIRMKKADDLNNTGLTFMMNQEYNAAVDCFKEAITLNNRLWGAYSNLGLAFSEKGEKDKAKDVFKKLIKLNPEFSESYYNLAMLLVEEDLTEKAVPLFRKSIEKRPDFAKAYEAMGNALYELDRIEFAVKAWEKAVALDPTLDETKEQLMKIKELSRMDGEEE